MRKTNVSDGIQRACFGTLIAVAASVFALACSNPTGSFFYGALGAGEPRLLVASGASPFTISLYDINGKLIKVLADYTAEGLQPRGLAPLDALTTAIAFDGTDQIGTLDLMGNKKGLIINANLTGNIYQMQRSSAGELFAIETNTIESFTEDGTRIGNPRINTTVGACTMNTPRGLAFNQNGQLAVTNTGNDRVLVYNVSNPSATTCVNSNVSIGAQDPFAVIAHSDGNLYVATQLNDQIYRMNADGSGAATAIWTTNLAVISNPTAMAELPDGTILVASDLTNTIERIDTSGARVGSTSFIADGLVGTVTEMIIIPEGH